MGGGASAFSNDGKYLEGILWQFLPREVAW